MKDDRLEMAIKLGEAHADRAMALGLLLQRIRNDVIRARKLLQHGKTEDAAKRLGELARLLRKV